jgi:myo-inositol 2-dehydrogenase/D-chiro-inositol 1-dehydrogenase
MARTKVAFVGSGGMAEAHSQAISRMKEAQIVGYCDVSLGLAQAKAAQYGGAAFRDAGKMMDDVEPDALFIALPPFAHGAELEAAKRGIPFFIEKPIGMDLELSRRIARAVARKKLITSVGYMNRYRRGVQTVREVLAGDPAVMMMGGWLGPTPVAHQGGGIWSWWIIKRKSGGQFLEQVTHTVDLARFLCGDATEVHAFAAKGFNTDAPPKYTIEDASVVNIKFESGAVANLWASCAVNVGGGVSLNVYGHRCAAFFTGWEHSVRLLRGGQDTVEIAGEPDIFSVEDATFLRAVRNRSQKPILSSYADGLRTMAISVAANESMKTGKPVKVSA